MGDVSHQDGVARPLVSWSPEERRGAHGSGHRDAGASRRHDRARFGTHPERQPDLSGCDGQSVELRRFPAREGRGSRPDRSRRVRQVGLDRLAPPADRRSAEQRLVIGGQDQRHEGVDAGHHPPPGERQRVVLLLPERDEDDPRIAGCRTEDEPRLGRGRRKLGR